MRLVIETKYPYEESHIQPAVAADREVFYDELNAQLKNYDPENPLTWWVAVCGAVFNSVQITELGGTVVAHTLDEWYATCV